MNKLGGSDYETARDRLRTVMIAAAIACVGSLLTPQSFLSLKLFLTIATILLFVTMLFIIVRGCRCPHCGKRILTGVLVVKVCPKCKRSLTTGKKVKR